MRRNGQVGRRAALVAATLVIWLATSIRLGATVTIDFSDLGPAYSSSTPSVYQGLDRTSNFQTECNADHASTYDNSYGSDSGFAVSNGGAPGSGLREISAAGTFDFPVYDYQINGLTLNVWPVRGGSK